MHQRMAWLLPLLLLPCVPTPRADAQPPPKGEVTKYTFTQSKIFPGTTRDYWVYVPKSYDPAKPACVYVNQDGIQFNAPAVFDELIALKEIPILIAVFVQPGRVKAPDAKALDRFNRSYEYDGLGDAYARFLLEELLPEVEKKKTTDGRAIKLSKDGNDRAIGGSSSGAVCAFTAAWERPDAFRRVFSAIGTYVGLRGANVYPTLIRKYEPKPLRVFLQDGKNDQNIYGGDWWMANQEMERSLTFAGYEVNHAWDEGGHSNAGGTKVFPDAMRWLWKGWPAQVKAGAGSAQLKEILLPGEDWKLVWGGMGLNDVCSGLAANAKGELFFNKGFPVTKTYKLGLDGKIGDVNTQGETTWMMAFGADGRLYSTTPSKGMLVFNDEGKSAKIADYRGRAVIVSHKGTVYTTAMDEEFANSTVRYISPTGATKIVDKGLGNASGITLSPDQTLLYVADHSTHWVYSYQIQPNGTLAHKQKYYHLHVPDSVEDSGANGMCVDRDGRLYVATHMGIQVCDQAGRVNCIIPTPNGKVINLCFGGENFDTLYATCGDRIYSRKLRVRGANAFQAPIKPAPPRL